MEREAVVFDRFFDWTQHLDWGRFVAPAIVFTLIGLFRFIGEKVKLDPSQVNSPNEPLPQTAKITVQAEVSFKERVGRLTPVFRVLLFFAGSVVILVGIQEIYAHLNPRGPYLQPEVSWLGAFLVALGAAVLWFGESRLRNFVQRPKQKE